MRDLYDIRSDYSTGPLALLRLILKRVGLKLVSRRPRINDIPTYVYRLCPDQLAKMRGYVESRRAFCAAGEMFQSTENSHVFRDLEQQGLIPANSGGDRENLAVEGQLIPFQG